MNIYRFRLFFITCLSLQACHSATADTEEAPVAEVRTPVTVTSVNMAPLAEYIELNATAAFLQQSIIKANANGYVEMVNTRIGSFVKSGQALFSVKTKESQSLGNSISILDSTLHFSGLNNIQANTTGYITELNHQPGDYVQDGEQLAVINNQNSFVFVLNLPYELRPYLSLNRKVELLLPDGVKLQATVSSMMPSVDSVSQTQAVILKVVAGAAIPANVVAKVRLVKTQKANAISLPKAAILTDEAQSYTWIMKMTDSSTAVKVPVQTGITANGMVEVISPKLSLSDRVLLTGNYGLPDTARVTIMKDK